MTDTECDRKLLTDGPVKTCAKRPNLYAIGGKLQRSIRFVRISKSVFGILAQWFSRQCGHAVQVNAPSDFQQMV
jgi:hypothetical protein